MFIFICKKKTAELTAVSEYAVMVRLGRFERPTYCLGGSCSILLSYNRIGKLIYYIKKNWIVQLFNKKKQPFLRTL